MPKFPSDDELDFFSLLPGGQGEGYYDPEALLALRGLATLPLGTLAAIDRELNDHGYILPGLGDAGDRIFGTK